MFFGFLSIQAVNIFQCYLQLQKSEKIKIEQLACSNLRHLSAMVECAMRPGVIAVCKIFHINDENKLLIDVISDGGKTWNKGTLPNFISLDYLFHLSLCF